MMWDGRSIIPCLAVLCIKRESERSENTLQTRRLHVSTPEALGMGFGEGCLGMMVSKSCTMGVKTHWFVGRL